MVETHPLTSFLCEPNPITSKWNLNIKVNWKCWIEGWTKAKETNYLKVPCSHLCNCFRWKHAVNNGYVHTSFFKDLSVLQHWSDSASSLTIDKQTNGEISTFKTGCCRHFLSTRACGAVRYSNENIKYEFILVLWHDLGKEFLFGQQCNHQLSQRRANQYQPRTNLTHFWPCPSVNQKLGSICFHVLQTLHDFFLRKEKVVRFGKMRCCFCCGVRF